MTRRATLGIDGNCGFALLGENIQEGECEFEEIVCDQPNWTSEYYRASKQAINLAFTRLKERCGPMSYYIGPGHPDHYR